MKTFELHITTEHGELFFGQASAVNINTRAGYITILPQHAPLVSVVAPGDVTVRTPEGEPQVFRAERGIIDVRPKKVIILLHDGDRP